VGAQEGRRPLVSGNWKMHHDHIEALHTVSDLGLRLQPADTELLDVSVHPPFTDLRTVQLLLDGEDVPVALGAQHCNPDDQGAKTGEVSPPMLARLDVRYVLVGHSERRQLFHMTDAEVAATLRGVLRCRMVPIVCVGETEEERAAGRTTERLGHQIRAALDGLLPDQVAGLVLAYEPIWAIGTGNPATAEDAEEACAEIRAVLSDLAGEAAAAVRIQYGGSVTPENSAEMVAEPDVDGLLVGGASLDAGTFLAIIREVAACYRSSAG